MSRLIRRALALAFVFLLGLPVLSVAAGPTVSMRVEGSNQTVIPRTQVTLNDTVVNKDGQAGHECRGTSMAGALEQASRGDWTATWYGGGLGYAPVRILSEAVDPNNGYWTVWRNNHESNFGVCQQASDPNAQDAVLRDGDEILLFHECFAAGCTSPGSPLGLTSVPRRAERGRSFTVTVVSYASSGAATPVAGASVVGGGASVVTDSRGQAPVTLDSTGTYTLKASKPGALRSADEPVCVSQGDDGTCAAASSTPAATSTPGLAGGTSTRSTLPGALLTGLKYGSAFSARRAPRVLTGTATPGSGGIASVRLRLTRRYHGRCQYFSGSKESFRGAGCGSGYFFKIEAERDFSYLLPRRLPPGRYDLQLRVTDRAGVSSVPSRGRSRILFVVHSAQRHR